MVKLKCGITDRIMPFLSVTKYFDCCRLMKRWKMLVMIMAKLLQTTNEKVVYIYDGNMDSDNLDFENAGIVEFDYCVFNNAPNTIDAMLNHRPEFVDEAIKNNIASKEAIEDFLEDMQKQPGKH